MHWFAENRDMEHPKLSSLPTAMQVRRMTQHNTPSQYEVNGRCRLVWLLGCPVGAAAVVMMVWFLVIEVRDDVHGEA